MLLDREQQRTFALRLEAFADSLRMMRVYFPHVLDLLETTGEQDGPLGLRELTDALVELGLRDISRHPAA